jgi:hypothetical protein
MNEQFSEEILKIIHKKTFINEWKNTKFREKPLIIFGNNGTGKSFLADYILNDTTVIKIDIEFCKNKVDFNEFLNMSFNKKSITMMFKNDKKNDNRKSIIIDDLTYIQKNDKSLFKSICEWTKNIMNIKNHKIIFICNKISNKHILSIYKKCFPVNTQLNLSNLTFLTEKFLLKDCEVLYSKETIQENIIRSQYNLHTIKNNLCFHKDNVENIHEVNLEQEDTLVIMKNLIEKNNINYTYQHSMNDYSILGLNFLENCGNIIKFNPKIRNKQNHNKLKDIIKLYHSLVQGDYLYTMIYHQNSWDNIENIITYNVYIPLHYYIKHCGGKKAIPLIYNKYLSHSIIYTHNSKLLLENKYNIHVIFKVYDLYYKLYYDLSIFKDNKERIKKEINYLLKHYEIDIKILNKFIKYYEYLFINKKIDKKVFKDFF